MAACILLHPMNTYAAENGYVGDVLQQAGIASLIEINLTQEEYVLKAQEAQGAAWGYTNIGIANVESGNLNVRAEASKSGKVVGKMPKNAACEILEVMKDTGWRETGRCISKVSLFSAGSVSLRTMKRHWS